MKSSLVSLAIAASIFLLVLGGYGMWYARVADKSAEVATLQQALTTKKNSVDRVATARAMLQKDADPAHSLANYFVAQDEVVSFISLLQNSAKERGATLEVIAVSTAENTKSSPALSFTLGVGGTFQAVMQTLGSIEYAPYVISFSALTLEKGDKGLWHAEVRMIVGSTL